MATRFRLRVAALILGVYSVIVLIVTLTPTPVDRPYASILQRAIAELHERGLPRFIDYAQIEFTSNIGMFIPIGFFLCLVVSIERWWLAGVLGTALSAFLELSQLVLLPGRFASTGDVIANGCGAFLGAALALGLRRVARYRDALVAQDVRGGRRFDSGRFGEVRAEGSAGSRSASHATDDSIDRA